MAGLGQRWDREADVVIVGYGFAGAASAIAAHDAGAQVLLLEKLPHPGGISILSGGGVAFARNAESAFAYLKRTCNGTTPDEVLRPLAQGMVEIIDWISELAKVSGTEPSQSEIRGRGTYPFPGTDDIDSIKLKDFPAYDAFPWAKGLRGGARLFKMVVDNVALRKIEVLLSTPARSLITGAGGEVLGVAAGQAGGEIKIKARRAVILASGGFENNTEMKLQYFQAQPVYPVYLGNTGDGILMAQKAGAALWHMWHFHGGYGFKYPEFPFAIRHVWAGPRNENRKMVWIAVDRFGKRFMNEYPPAPQDTGARPLEHYDPDIQDYPRIPCYLIFDEEGRKLGPVAMAIVNDARYHYRWSEDNLAEVEKGWIKKAESIEALAALIELSPEALSATVARWNEQCAAGNDGDFRRPPKTMMSLTHPPFYAMEAWPIVSNTQGGPVHDAQQRVLDPMGQPIARLYVAGDISSVFGHLYLEAGNVTECFVGGRIAGRNAAKEPAWD
ncbi:MAG TPA: FAD-dependent oxidoreductase [Candidatus Acidoferrales bacterium]|nr:FAD-dependent oxidoreductase [Candidatus Acidoferrales bacterium]